MSRFSAALAVFFLMFLSLSDLKAQSGSSADDVLLDRYNKLESICGEWSGQLGTEKADASLYMDDSSSAIGDLQRGDKFFFIHCFAEDMVKDDRHDVGVKGGYDYCIMQQSEGELVAVLYLSLKGKTLKGISVEGSKTVEVLLSRKGDAGDSVASGVDAQVLEDDRWRMVYNLNTLEAYTSYIADFPEGKYVEEARREVMMREDNTLWQKALEEDSAEAYQEYLASSSQYKAYANAATGRLALLAAKEADKAGDFNEVLASLEKAETYVNLSNDMIKLRMKNQELKSYDNYVNAANDLQAISRGVEFVNEFLYSDKHDEVSDRVAYLMASSPNYLAGTPAEVMLTYAKTDETKEYVIKKCKQAARMRYRQPQKKGNLGFNFGIGGSVSNPLEAFAPVYGGHFLFSIGDNRNFMNFEFGARYGYWSFVNKQDAEDTYDFHQLRLVAAPKFNLVRQKKSNFYLYVAPEVAYGYPIDPHATRTYEPNSLSFGGRVGFGIGHFDLSASYMLDYWPMVKETFTGSYYPTMAGIALTYYISGSGR